MGAAGRMPAGRVILTAGVVMGLCDITAALVVYGLRGAAPGRVLQTVAAGVLGADSFKGGAATMALGLFLHFVIATGAAAVYYAASRHLSFLIDQALWIGPLYGGVVFFVMDRVIVPLSAVPKRPFSWTSLWIGLAIHAVCVGPPVALTVARLSGRR